MAEGPPDPPTILSTSSTSTTITLSWSAVEGATGYDVKQDTSDPETTAPSSTSYTFNDLTPNTPYTLYVRSKKGSAPPSAWTPRTVATAPDAPGIYGLYLPGSDRTSLGLNWSTVAGATDYQVKIGPDGAPAPATADSWHIFDHLTLGVEYTFYVRAVNSWGSSGWSKSATNQGTVPPAAPTGLNAAAAGADLKLSWTAARLSDTTIYQVKLNDGAPTAADSINGHTFSGLTPSTEYTLYVRASNGGGPSPWSPATATTVPVAPRRISVTKGVDYCGKIADLSLSWDSVAGATAYEVRLGENRAAITVTDTRHSFNYTDYESEALEDAVYVRAKNSGGVSAWRSSLMPDPTYTEPAFPIAPKPVLPGIVCGFVPLGD